MKRVVITLYAIACLACNGAAFKAGQPQTASKIKVNNNIDPLLCSAGAPSGPKTVYYPTACLVPQVLPSNTMGFQLNNAYQLPGAKNFTIHANGAGTTQDTVLYIEVATYTMPDSIIITAYNAQNTPTQILNICNIATYVDVDPTNGQHRPFSSTILQFGVEMPAGTTRLIFDYGNSDTPTYLGVWGLNEFSSWLGNSNNNPFLSVGLGGQFRVQNNPLNTYNDNQDPFQSQPMCPNN